MLFTDHIHALPMSAPSERILSPKASLFLDTFSDIALSPMGMASAYLATKPSSQAVVEHDNFGLKSIDCPNVGFSKVQNLKYLDTSNLKNLDTPNNDKHVSTDVAERESRQLLSMTTLV